MEISGPYRVFIAQIYQKAIIRFIVGYSYEKLLWGRIGSFERSIIDAIFNIWDVDPITS
jgi:hypothetical protein